MKIRELQAGFYKVQRQNNVAFGAKHPRRNTNTVQILRVIGDGQSRKYYFDHDIFGEASSENNTIDDYEIISRYDGMPQIVSCKVILSFKDSGGNEFNWTVRDTWTLRGVFDNLPWLSKAFGFTRRPKQK